jgi:hypothetical protein
VRRFSENGEIGEVLSGSKGNGLLPSVAIFTLTGQSEGPVTDLHQRSLRNVQRLWPLLMRGKGAFPGPFNSYRCEGTPRRVKVQAHEIECSVGGKP